MKNTMTKKKFTREDQQQIWTGRKINNLEDRVTENTQHEEQGGGGKRQEK